MILRHVAALAALVAVLAPRGVRAAESIHVRAEGCTMRTAELERLVRLELSSVLGPESKGSYDVTVRCRDGIVDIGLFDPLTNKKVERTVRSPPSTQPEPERLIALTIAQLYRAAWLELAADDPPPLPPARVAAVAPAETRSAKATAERALADEAERPLPWSVALVAGAHARRLQTPLVMPSVEVDATWAPTGTLVWLLVHGGVEWASVTRERGTISTVLVRAGGGVGLEPLVSGIWSGFAELAGGVGYARLAGEDVAKGYRGGVVSGPGFDGAVTLGGAARVGPVRFELLGRVGVLVGTPAGLVDGEDELSLDGPWAGGAVRLRWLL